MAVTCMLFERQFSSYLDGELPMVRAARLEAHLRKCPHCRAELAAMGGIADHIRAASRELQVSQDFDRRVLRAMGYWQVTGRPIAEPKLLKPLLVVATVLLAMMGMVRYYLSQPYGPPAPVAQPAAVMAPALGGGAIAPDEDRGGRAP